VKAPAAPQAPVSSALHVVAQPPQAPVPAGELAEPEARRVDFAWSAVMVGSLALVFALLSVFGGVAVPVLLALGMAYVLNPIVTALERRGLNRSLGTTAVFSGCALLMVGAVLYLIPVFREEASKLPDFFVRASAQVVPRVESWLGRPLPDLLRQRMTELGTKASELLQSAGPTAARLVASFAGNTARFSEVDDVLSAFVRGQLTVGAILTVLYSTGLGLARIDMAIVIGVIAGFGNMVPYLGTTVGVVLALLGVMLSWQGAWQLAVVAGTFLVAQMAEGLFITPRIVGDKVGLSSVTVIIAILAFGELFGFTGILLAVPTTAILKVVLRVVVERYQRTALYTGEGPGA
jgi:predicted PurR-regulated permease PerM